MAIALNSHYLLLNQTTNFLVHISHENQDQKQTKQTIEMLTFAVNVSKFFQLKLK